MLSDKSLVKTLILSVGLALANSTHAVILFEENFESGLDNNNWQVWNNDDRPAQFVGIDNGTFYTRRSGVGGNGGTSAIYTQPNLNIDVTSNTIVSFSANPIYRSVGAGCGWNCAEYPAVVELYLEDAQGHDMILRRAVNYGSAIKDISHHNDWSGTNTFGYTFENGFDFKQIATSAPQNQFSDISFDIQSYFPEATKIQEILIYANGWDYQGRIDDLVITDSSFLSKEENNYKTIIRDRLGQPILGHLEYWEHSDSAKNVNEYFPDSFLDISSASISDPTLFDPDAPTYVLVHGWRPENLNNDEQGGVPQDQNHEVRTQIRGMAEKLYDRYGDNINILAYNYEYEAGSAYTHAEMAALCLTTIGQSTGYCNDAMSDFVPNHQVDRQALKLSESLSKYLDLVDPNGNGFTGDLNFVGHSLGAGIVGHAVALDSEDSISNKYGDQIKKITLIDAPDDWTSFVLGGNVNLDGAIDKINANDKTNPEIENYIASKGVRAFGVDYSGAINTYLEDENHTSAGWYWYPITMQSSARINTTPELTDADTLYSKRSGFNQTWNSTSYDKTFETTELSRWEVVEKTSFFDSISPFSSDDAGNIYVDYHWFNDNSALNINHMDLVFTVDGSSGRRYKDENNNVVHTGISASPILFNTDLLLDFATDWVSFEFNVSDIDYDDILVLAINGDVLYERRGNSINQGLWDFSGLIDVSSYHNQFISLTLGLYTDDTGKSFSFRNLKFYESTATVPNINSLSLMSIGLISFLIFRRKRKLLN